MFAFSLSKLLVLAGAVAVVLFVFRRMAAVRDGAADKGRRAALDRAVDTECCVRCGVHVALPASACDRRPCPYARE